VGEAFAAWALNKETNASAAIPALNGDLLHSCNAETVKTEESETVGVIAGDSEVLCLASSTDCIRLSAGL
jgi:hypothetical protein